MTENSKRFTLRNSVLLSAICCILLLCPVIASADAVPKLSDPSFSEAFIELVGAHDVSATPQQAARNPYITARLIVKSSDAHLDPDKYGAIDAIRNSDGVYFLQFESSEKARAAEKLLKMQAATEYVEPDVMVFVSDESPVEGMFRSIVLECIEFVLNLNVDILVLSFGLTTLGFNNPDSAIFIHRR